MNKPHTVVVYVEGGNVQGVRSNSVEVDVKIFDVDNLKAEGKSRLSIDRAWAKLEKEAPIPIL